MFDDKKKRGLKKMWFKKNNLPLPSLRHFKLRKSYNWNYRKDALYYFVNK